ncbi:Tyrosine recombinase XerC [subsurface metagenome]
MIAQHLWRRRLPVFAVVRCSGRTSCVTSRFVQRVSPRSVTPVPDSADCSPVKSIIVPAEIAKNKKERQVPVSTRLCDALTEHHRYNMAAYPGSWHSFFHKTDYGFAPLTTRQVERFIRAAAERSIGRPVHPHILRHTFGSRLMRVASTPVVMELLGHQSMTSTAIYMHPNEDDKRKAIDAVVDGVTEQTEEGAEASRLANVPDRSDTS